MLSWGIDLQISTYTPVFFAAVCITYLELYFSNLPHWKPNKREVKNDVIYMIFVQTLLPKVLGFIAAILLLRSAQAENLLISLRWPHDMPVCRLRRHALRDRGQLRQRRPGRLDPAARPDAERPRRRRHRRQRPGRSARLLGGRERALPLHERGELGRE